MNHKYIAAVVVRDPNGIVTYDRVFGSVREFRRWCRATFDFGVHRLDVGEYLGQSDDTMVSVKLDKIY